MFNYVFLPKPMQLWTLKCKRVNNVNLIFNCNNDIFRNEEWHFKSCHLFWICSCEKKNRGKLESTVHCRQVFIIYGKIQTAFSGIQQIWSLEFGSVSCLVKGSDQGHSYSSENEVVMPCLVSKGKGKSALPMLRKKGSHPSHLLVLSTLLTL